MSARPDPYAEMERLRARLAELERALALRDQGDAARNAGELDRFRMLVEHSRDFVALADLDQRLLYLNAAGRDLLGLEAEDDITRLTLADLIPADRLTHFRAVELPALLERGMWQGEAALRQRHGAIVPVLSRSFLLRTHPGAEPIAIGTIKHSLADRLQSEEALRRRVELERLVASISQGFIHCGAEAMPFQIDITLELLGSFVGADRSVLMLAAEGGSEMQVSHEWCAPGVVALKGDVPPLAFVQYPWGHRRLADGDVICIDALDTLPPEAAAERRLMESLGIRSLLLVPMVSERRMMGCIGFNRGASERAWAVADINLLRTAADIIANARARRGMEQALRASEQKFAGIFTASPDAISLTTVDDGRFVDVNPAFERISGYPRDAVIGRSALELGIWVRHSEREALVQELRERGAVTDFEARFRRRDGTELDALVSAFPLHIEGQPCAVLISRDVSERKAMERTIRRSETVLRAIVENIPDAVWMKDSEGRYIVGNRALARFFGRRTLDDVIGRTATELLPGSHAERMQRDDEVVARTRSQLTTEESVDLRGEMRWYETVKAPVVDSAGELAGTTGISHNVTQRKLIEQALRQSEARFRQFAEDLPFIIWMAAVDRSRFLFVNRSYERVFGRSIEALMEDPADWFRAVHPDDRAAVISLDEFSARRGLYIDEFRIVRPDGGVRWLRNHVIPLEDERGEVYLHAGISEDVTERKNAEEEVARLTGELEERVRNRTAALHATLNELESFSYSVSHDLRTPLRGINGFSHILLEDYGAALDATATGYLRRICAASERMGQLIDDLLTLARLSRAEIHPVELDLGRLAGDILDELALSEPGRRVERRIAADLIACGDPMLVQLLMQNLLVNAWKFSARRDTALIEVGCTVRSGAREFFVRDNGAGFDDAFSGSLFKPFQRLHGVEEFPGTGIGLATVKRIADRHGGKVRAQGRPDAGATFYFTLG